MVMWIYEVWVSSGSGPAGPVSARFAEYFDGRGEHGVVEVVGRVEHEAIDDAAEAFQQGGAERVRLGDHGEGL